MSEKILDSIQCKKCIGQSKDGGCGTCSGYRIVLKKIACPTCGGRYWIKPGNMTMYDGKVFHSFDGVEITCHISKPNTCDRCEKE